MNGMKKPVLTQLPQLTVVSLADNTTAPMNVKSVERPSKASATMGMATAETKLAARP